MVEKLRESDRLVSSDGSLVECDGRPQRHLHHHRLARSIISGINRGSNDITTIPMLHHPALVTTLDSSPIQTLSLQPSRRPGICMPKYLPQNRNNGHRRQNLRQKKTERSSVGESAGQSKENRAPIEYITTVASNLNLTTRHDPIPRPDPAWGDERMVVVCGGSSGGSGVGCCCGVGGCGRDGWW